MADTGQTREIHPRTNNPAISFGSSTTNSNNELYQSGGWVATRGSSKTFWSPVVFHDTITMGEVGGQRRVPDPVRFPPQPWRPPKVHDMRERDEAVEKLLTCGVLEKAPDQADRWFLSDLFVLKEKSKNRLIFNCSKLNTFVQVSHFKMEGVRTLREMLAPGEFMTKIDCQDVYMVVPMHPDSRRYLNFEFHGEILWWTALPFGLNSSPRIYSKLVRAVALPLRTQGIRMVQYLDDWCLVGRSKQALQAQTKTVLDHLIRLGFLINWRKSVLVPSQTQEFLGFLFDSQKMEIQVPQGKIKQLHVRIKQALKETHSCRWIAALIGKMTALIPAVGEALLHVRFLQRDLAQSLQGRQSRWESECPLSADARKELTWWQSDPLVARGLPVRTLCTTTSITDIYVDSSGSRFGISSPLGTAHGFWRAEELVDSINVRELKAILFALKIHAEKLRNQTFTIHSDNTTALKYAKNQGGTASIALQVLALQIQEVVRTYNLNVIYRHITGTLNVDADRLSRSKKPAYEQSVTRQEFQRIRRRWPWFPFMIDAFGAQHNHTLPHYWSYKADPFAEAVDAFQQTWPKTGLYLFPPWRFVPQVLHKLQQDAVQDAILVTPTWPSQFWWPMVLQWKRGRPLHLTSARTGNLTVWLL